MGEIERDAGDPHGEVALPAAHDAKPGDVHQGPEQQPPEARDHRPEQGGAVLAEQHGHHHQQRPDEHIAEPPGAEAEDQPLQQHIDPHRGQRLPAEKHRGQDDQHRVQLDIGDGGQRRLDREDQRPHQGEDGDLPGGKLTSRS